MRKLGRIYLYYLKNTYEKLSPLPHEKNKKTVVEINAKGTFARIVITHLQPREVEGQSVLHYLNNLFLKDDPTNLLVTNTAYLFEPFKEELMRFRLGQFR
jgi:hypothetical protein